MEPLPTAQIAGLTPGHIDVAFWDDRMERIPYDDPTDLVAITVETYTAKRAYQIASEYRKRGVPVVMGGFHPTLVPNEVVRYAESVVVGEAESTWPQLLADFERGAMKRVYRAANRPDISRTMPDRRIFGTKNYLPFALVEAGRGCTQHCEFCAIQTGFGATQTMRSPEVIVEEIKQLKRKRSLFFFVDDNIVAHLDKAKELFRALVPLKIRWVSQASINMTYDRELLELMKRAGCLGVLVGFESLNDDNLRSMNKGFNTARGGAAEAVKRLHEHELLLYATFVFGYDGDTLESFRHTVQFGIDNRIFMMAFNHCTPFPGTPLYQRLEQEGRLLYDKWWLDDRYRYGQVPYKTAVPPEVIQAECVKARKHFYGPRSILRRLCRTNTPSLEMLRNYLFINLLLRKEASQREHYPLGDLGFQGELLETRLPMPSEPVRPALVQDAVS
ncbi:MAG: B12-binding domain-containing radical SAM protein [Polyangiaceae bacterium]|nr:B12-binding domain-containing radical SAM protein [Polyangiaceae bacterium]